jgi:hypothetical protein
MRMRKCNHKHANAITNMSCKIVDRRKRTRLKQFNDVQVVGLRSHCGCAAADLEMRVIMVATPARTIAQPASLWGRSQGSLEKR